MRFSQLTAISISVLFLSACVETTTTKVYTIKTSITTSQAEIDLLIAKAKLEERTRIMASLAKQAEEEKVFAKLKLEKQAVQEESKPGTVDALASLDVNKEKDSESESLVDPIVNPSVVSHYCQVYQVVPSQYNGNLKAVLEKSTPIKGNKQLLPVLCKSDRTPALIEQLQRALEVRDYLLPSPPNDLVVIDGIWGENTLNALRAYQKDRGLAYGLLSIEVLADLKVAGFHHIKESSIFTPENDSLDLTTSPETTSDELMTPVETNVAVAGVTIAEPVTAVDTISVIDSPEIDKTLPISDSSPSPVSIVPDSKIRYCSALQIIPDVYKGTLKAVLSANKTTNIKTQRLPTLCKISRSVAIIEKLQVALEKEGYLKPSPPYDLVVIDGIWGENTLNSVRAYQKDHGLAYGQLSIEVLEHLKVL